MGLPRRRLAFAAALLVTAVPWPTWDASASCAAPYLQMADTSAGTPVLVRGSSITVEGRAFVDGCNDGGSSDAWGCSSDEGEAEVPMDDVTLRIRQGQREWELGTEDAGTADGNRLGHVAWTTTVPVGLKPGRATLQADGSGPLHVRVRVP